MNKISTVILARGPPWQYYLDLPMPRIQTHLLSNHLPIFEAEYTIDEQFPTKEIVYVFHQRFDTARIQEHFPQPTLFTPV